MFEEDIAKAAGIIYYQCSEETMEKRLLGRAEGGEKRDDDNAEVIRKRFRVNVEECEPVVESYKKEGRCFVIDANRDKEEVYNDTKKVFVQLGEKPKK
ncbi:hypothetical protein AGDE_01082 [Angomonas deanei]|nr:hypothetical protein AGDE_10627 [Angomonas deanei]EPY38202.1 hypothetical protein AGDE_05729 [Angomonas deanei]EPY42841.1 hypothetical protein AGDE_01082 [Angomonas deanei]|eukprot:EPY27716.1 hypothetical protein AGDE_10627 [Angomonas deanei]